MSRPIRRSSRRHPTAVVAAAVVLLGVALAVLMGSSDFGRGMHDGFDAGYNAPR